MTPRLPALTADRYIIAVGSSENARKLFQIIPARDGGLYVGFPYLPFERGRVGFITFKQPEENVIWGDDAPLTTNNVKYSHHPTGQVQFSQTGRIKSAVRKSGVPFGEAKGHIFTARFQGIDRYECFQTGKRPRKTHVVRFAPFSDGSAYKFVAHVYSLRDLVGRVFGQSRSPWIKCMRRDGSMVGGIFLATNYRDQLGLRFVLLTLESEERFCRPYEQAVTFLGGFDPPEIALDPFRPTTALTFFYPEMDSSEELLKRVGTIDISPPPAL